MKQLVVKEPLQPLCRLANRPLWQDDADTPGVGGAAFIPTGGLDEINFGGNMPGIRGKLGRGGLDDFPQLGLVVITPLEHLVLNKIDVLPGGDWAGFLNLGRALERT